MLTSVWRWLLAFGLLLWLLAYSLLAVIDRSPYDSRGVRDPRIPQRRPEQAASTSRPASPDQAMDPQESSCQMGIASQPAQRLAFGFWLLALGSWLLAAWSTVAPRSRIAVDAATTRHPPPRPPATATRHPATRNRPIANPQSPNRPIAQSPIRQSFLVIQAISAVVAPNASAFECGEFDRTEVNLLCGIGGATNRGVGRCIAMNVTHDAKPDDERSAVRHGRRRSRPPSRHRRCLRLQIRTSK